MVIPAIASGTSGGIDADDRHLPPPAPGQKLTMGLQPSEAVGTAARGELLLQDVRPDTDSLIVWWVELVSSERPVELSWGDPQCGAGDAFGIPEWFVTVTERGSGRRWEMNHLHSLQLPRGSHALQIEAERIGASKPEVRRLWVSAEPNPSIGQTVIRYGMPVRASVLIEVFDATGARMWKAEKEEKVAGEHAIVWNGIDERGVPIPAGIYFLRARMAPLSKSGGHRSTTTTQKFTVVR